MLDLLFNRMELQIQELQAELIRVKQERDNAVWMCSVVQEHYKQLVQATIHGRPKSEGSQTTRTVSVTATTSIGQKTSASSPAPENSSGRDSRRVESSTVDSRGVESSSVDSRRVNISGVDSREVPTVLINQEGAQSPSKQQPIGQPIQTLSKKPQNARSQPSDPNRDLCNLPKNNDVIIISDSLFRAIDPSSFGDRDVSLFAFSGMKAKDLTNKLKMLKRQNIKAIDLVICVGTNDYWRSTLSNVTDDILERSKAYC